MKKTSRKRQGLWAAKNFAGGTPRGYSGKAWRLRRDSQLTSKGRTEPCRENVMILSDIEV